MVNAPAYAPAGRAASVEIGLASWYGPPYHGRQSADGSVFDQNAMTAAHRTLPLGTTIRVTNVATGQAAVMKITDRGPFVAGRILDLSVAAAKATGVYRVGIAKVKIEAYEPANADPEGRWCVQVGAFASAAEAVHLKNELLRRYAAAKVIEFAGPTGYWVRITLAQPDRERTEKVLSSIKTSQAVPFLVRLD
jgi:rare lipoprotein A